MRNILIFSIAYYPRLVGGAEVAIKEITDRISPHEIAFYMVTVHTYRDLPRYEKIGNVHVYRVGFSTTARAGSFFLRYIHTLNKYMFPVWACLVALRLHKKYSFDGIWAMMANYAGFAALFFKLCVPRVRFFLTLQEGDPIEYIKRRVFFVYPIFLHIFRRADRVQTISTYLASFARSMGYRGHLEVIPNGVDISLFSQIPSMEVKEKIWSKLEKKSGDVFVITTSRLVVKNGIADVIRALPFLKENIRFVVIGVGDLESDLKKLVRDLSVEKRVSFLGFVPYREIPHYLHVSDVFIRPSLSEGMGNSFIEAMAASLPVIATPVGGITDFIKDRETGIFCEVGNSSSIASAISLLIEHEALREHIVNQALSLVSERYDWQDIAERLQREFFVF